jgi:S1-C subfamily serine protease
MKKIGVLLLLLVLLTGCVSNKKTEFVKPDYTQNQIVESEIQRLEELFVKEPLYVLWQSLIMKTSNSENALINDFYELNQKKVYQLLEESISKSNWKEALLYSTSLESVGSSFFKDDLHKNVQTQYLLKAEEDALLKNQVQSVPSFIQGTVTVWVDQGVKVEGGRGYADRVIGSGFFIHKDGYIITNHHVIANMVDPKYEGYARLYIKLSSDTETRIPAKVVSWDPSLDLALLKAEIDVPYVFTLGSSSDLDVGDSIFAIGSPLGLESTITSGIVSSFDRKVLSTVSVMQIDAAINSGNSGGPLIDKQGGVQGVVFASITPYEGLNFAIPVEYVKMQLPRMFQGGEITHSWIGGYGRTKKTTENKNIGVEVLYTMSGGILDIAGIQKNDIITSISGVSIDSVEQLQNLLVSTTPKTIIPLTYIRNNESKTVSVYLDIRPENPGYEMYLREPEYKFFLPAFGLELTPTSSKDKKQFFVSHVIKGSTADESGFSVNDPVEIVKVKLEEKNTLVYTEIYTKKRKSGYLDVNFAMASALDSPYFF